MQVTKEVSMLSETSSKALPEAELSRSTSLYYEEIKILN